MIPIFTTSTSFLCPQTKALEHGALLLKGVVIAFATTKSVTEIVVVFVVGIRLLRVDSTAGVGSLVGAQGAWASRWDSSRAAIAGEVSLLENLDEGMFAMALDGTGVADTSGVPSTASLCRRRIAGQASKDILPQWTEDLGAVLNALGKVSR